VPKFDKQEFQQRFGKIEGLIQDIERMANPSAQATAKALVQALLDLHSTGLQRMLEITYQTGAAGQAIIDDLGRDEMASSLLILHGLHPLDLETRVRQALTKVRPYLGSHGGNVELLNVTAEGVVSLRLEGSCHGCPSSRVTLKYAIEEEIYKAAPDVVAIQVEGAVENQPVRPAGFIPVSELLGQDSNGGGWVEVDGLASLKEGSLRTMEVSGKPVLFCRVDEQFYAYSNICSKCGQWLGQAKLAGKDLACPACGQRYDVMRAGRSLDEPNLHLEPFPLLEERSQIKIALPVPAY
jgi:Fe-S cluster biogenesis protein NfuA/nitrite reductase/ring-hydroxylating ferredoxin subunit